mgnify:CR=1 FL=1
MGTGSARCAPDVLPKRFGKYPGVASHFEWRD